jgi:DNA-binding SARP family transcriptional activator
MIALRTLGGLDSDDVRPGAETRSQPKRLALLAYLAVERGAAFVRRDVLLSLFWPKLPEAHARLALRQALHHLRRIAPPDRPILARGPDDVAINCQNVSCDACVFERECAAQAAGALQHYRGDFLEGVHVAGASPEFEEWVARQRQRYRDLAVRAAWRLASIAHRAGDLEGAVTAAEQAVRLAPDDEPGLRRLMLLHDAGGNRATALRHYERFARRLALDLDAAPSPATRALADELRRDAAPAARC